MKFILPYLFIIIFLLSCSKNEDISNNNIIGKWIQTELYINGEKIDVPVCETLYYTEYDAYNLVWIGNIKSENRTDDCPYIASNVGFKWKSIGNNKFSIYYIDLIEGKKEYIITFDEDKQTLITDNNNIVVVYELLPDKVEILN